MANMDLNFGLRVGYSYKDAYINTVGLSAINGIAETIILQRLQNKPYTFMGNILAATILNLGSETGIATNTRNEFAKSRNVVIPDVIMSMPLAEINTLIVEVHRRLWKQIALNQVGVCKFCGKSFEEDIDLSRIDYSPADLERLENEDNDFSKVLIEVGYDFMAAKLPNGNLAPAAQYDGFYDNMVFRAPTLRDAIKYQSDADNTVVFYRKIALDCLLSVTNSTTGQELPVKLVKERGLKFFDIELGKKDLEAIRTAIRDHVPTMPFYYLTDCPCPQKKEIPVSFEGSNFFSE
jgi:hypothetical protein